MCSKKAPRAVPQSRKKKPVKTRVLSENTKVSLTTVERVEFVKPYAREFLKSDEFL